MISAASSSRCSAGRWRLADCDKGTADADARDRVSSQRELLQPGGKVL